DVDAVDVVGDSGVTELGVVVRADAADEHLGVALLGTELQRGRGLLHVADVANAGSGQVVLSEGADGAWIILNVALTTIDRDLDRLDLVGVVSRFIGRGIGAGALQVGAERHRARCGVARVGRRRGGRGNGGRAGYV